MKLLYIFIILFSINSFSQTIFFTGVITNDSKIPLENANIIALPLIKKEGVKFAIADSKGRFKFELDSNERYEITASYLGYFEEILTLEPNTTIVTYEFKLKAKEVQLKEIVLIHDRPISIKKDTITYNIKSFANGNERKMKEILEKLPGVEVDRDGGVTVQGKKVTQMLVEGKPFFGGGSKLAVENIPADALDKIEVIDNFNQVGFLKQVSDSEDLAMNVKLKEDKKKFVFGDIDAGLEAGNDDRGYYLAHTALFYYSPRTNLSFIGDINNVGKRVFTYQDLRRFQGGASSFIEGRKSLSNLYPFATVDNDVIQNKSQFGAFNFSHDFSSKLAVSGFGIFSKILTDTKSETYTEYLQNSRNTFEHKYQKGNSESVLGIANLKLDYSPNKKGKWFYNAQYQSISNDLLQTINSITNSNSSLFETLRKADNTSVKQYLEWHKSYNTSHTTTFVMNQAFEDNNPINQWITNQPFLQGIIPIQYDDLYIVRQVKAIKNNSIDVLLKHYWVLNNYNHIYTNIGNNFGTSDFKTSEEQVLTNGSANNFSSAGFGNNTKYQLNDAYLGIEYKSKIKKWTNKIAMYLHQYHLTTSQTGTVFSLSKTMLQPQLNSDYDFNNSEALSFNYKLVNNFPEVSLLANQYTLQSYNMVYKGNALLENEQYHSANLRYSKMNNYRGLSWNVGANFIKKIKTIRNEVQINGINQYNTPILNSNPETNYSVSGFIGKNIYRFNLRLISSLDWLNYLQTLNNVTTSNNRNNQKIGILLKTTYKKWPDFRIGYTKGFGQFSGLTKSNFQTTAIDSELDFRLFQSWNYRFSYQRLRNGNSNNQNNFYNIANTSIRYQKKNSPFGFELSITNCFNSKTKNEYSFSDYAITERSTYVMPRVILFSLSYKL